MDFCLNLWNGGYLRTKLFKGGDFSLVNSYGGKKCHDMSYLWANNNDVEQLPVHGYDLNIFMALLDSRTQALLTHSYYLTSSKKM